MQTAVEKITDMISPSVEARGYRIVRVRLMGNDRNRILQIMAERISDGHMEVGDCEQVSRLVSALLDVEDPIQGAYNLEVSSPGIDRPLVRMEEFEEYVGHLAKIETHGLINGRKRFKGPLLKAVNNQITIQVDNTEYEIPFTAVAQSQLILTDALMDYHEKKYKPKQTEVIEIEEGVKA